MKNLELKNILVAYKNSKIGLLQAHDEIIQLFSTDEPIEQVSKVKDGECMLCGNKSVYINGWICEDCMNY